MSRDNVDKFDVAIVGGGAAGVAAAIGARQAAPNARILLVESEGYLGGAGTHRGVVSFCGLFTLGSSTRQAVGGVWDMIREKLLEVGGTSERPVRHRGVFQVFEPECLKLVLDNLMAEHRVDVLLHTMVVGANRDVDSRITSIFVQERRGRQEIQATAFVDSSGDGDLAYYGGASTRYGNHGFVNLGSLATRFGGISPPSAASSTKWSEAIRQAKAERPELEELIKKDASVLLRLPQSNDVVAFLASASYDARDSRSITAAEVSGRKQAHEYLRILRALPGHERMFLVSSGPNFGTRESRHVNAVYQLTEEDIMDGKRFADVMALGAWGVEYHDASKSDWASIFKIPPKGPFQIPLRSLRSVDTPNLFVAGRCVDGDQYAGSAVRVMGTAMATGQAAGVAAGLSAAKLSIRHEDLDPVEVQECLRKHGALLDPSNLPEAPPVEQAS